MDCRWLSKTGLPFTKQEMFTTAKSLFLTENPTQLTTMDAPPKPLRACCFSCTEVLFLIFLLPCLFTATQRTEVMSQKGKFNSVQKQK